MQSPARNLDTVTAFLNQKKGQQISDVEVEGLVSLIQKSAVGRWFGQHVFIYLTDPRS